MVSVRLTVISHENTHDACGHRHTGRNSDPISPVNRVFGTGRQGLAPPAPAARLCRRLEGLPAAASITGFPGDCTCPAVPREGPRAGSTHINSKYITGFHRFDVNGTDSWVFLLTSTRP